MVVHPTKEKAASVRDGWWCSLTGEQARTQVTPRHLLRRAFALGTAVYCTSRLSVNWG